jgi:hypothetical protein
MQYVWQIPLASANWARLGKVAALKAVLMFPGHFLTSKQSTMWANALSCRMLLWDSAVGVSEYRSCLNRMLGNAQQLSGLLHGTCVRVAEVNAVWADRGGIDIAWNWRM